MPHGNEAKEERTKAVDDKEEGDMVLSLSPAQLMPSELLQMIGRVCPLRDVAKLHLVCKSWHDGLESSPFYSEVCKKNWASPLCNPHLSPYGGSWRKVFLCKVAATISVLEIMNEGVEALAELSDRVSQAVDDDSHDDDDENKTEEDNNSNSSDEDEEGSTSRRGRRRRRSSRDDLTSRTPWIQDLFENFMKATFHLGLKVTLRRCVKSKALEAYLQATYSMLEQPFMRACLDDFVIRTEELCQIYDVWNGGFIEWPSVPWRRSAIEFVNDLYVQRSCPHNRQSPIARLYKPGIVKALDVTIGSTAEEAMELFVPPVPGLPKSHWWWFPTMGSPFHHC